MLPRSVNANMLQSRDARFRNYDTPFPRLANPSPEHDVGEAHAPKAE